MLLRKLSTLVFLRDQDQILLGFKKSGFGEDKWNGFPGKILPNESMKEAAARTVSEKCGVTVNPSDLENIAHLEFTFVGEPLLMEIRVFSTSIYQGTPRETSKLRPKWFTPANIPYEDMWPDAAVWFPYILQNKKIVGRFHYDKLDTLLHHQIEEQESVEAFYEDMTLLS